MCRFTFVHSLDQAARQLEWSWEGATSDFRWTANNSLRLIRNGDEVIDSNPRTGEIRHESKIRSKGPFQLLNRDWAYSNVDNEGHVVSIENPDLNYVMDGPRTIGIAHGGNSIAVMMKQLCQAKIFRRTGEWSYLQTPSELMQIKKIEYSHSSHRLALAGGGLGTDDGTEMFAGWLHTANVNGEPDYRRVRIGEQRILASAVAWSPDDLRIVVANDEGLCALYSAQDITPIWTRNLHRARVSHLAWHPSGQRVASAGIDRRINIWEPQTGDIVLSLPVEEPVSQLEFSPDGMMLAAAVGDRKIVVWDSLAGQSFADSKLRFDMSETSTLKELVRQQKWTELQDLLNRKHTFPQPLLAFEQLELATINVYVKDIVKYRMTCKLLMENAAQLTQPFDQYYAGWTCALAPLALDDYSVAIQLVNQSVTQELARDPSEQTNLPPFLTCLGALQYRSAQHALARETLSRVVSTAARDAVRPPYAEYLLALTCHALGDLEAARR